MKAVASSKEKRRLQASLAINGGPRVRTRPNPPFFPGGLEIGAEEKEAVNRVLESKRLYRYYGPDVDAPSVVSQFEGAVAQRLKARYALAVNSGTSSLFTAVVAIGIGPGDEVIVPAYTYYATASAVLAAGGIPIIADVDDTLNLDPASVSRCISPYTKAIAVVHMRGAPAALDELLTIATDQKLVVIEDVAQAFGGSYRGRALGTVGAIGCFSLQYNKIITSGEGGVLVTDDPDLMFRMACIHDSGASWRPRSDLGPTVDVTEYLPGVGLRMSELTGAVALAQLRRLDTILARMRSTKRRLRSAVEKVGGVELRRLVDPAGDTGIALVFFAVSAEHAAAIVDALVAEGVPASRLFDGRRHDLHVYSHWKDVMAKRTTNSSGFPYAAARREVDYHPDMCRRSVDLLLRAVQVDVSPQLTEGDIDEIERGLQKVLIALSL